MHLLRVTIPSLLLRAWHDKQKNLNGPHVLMMKAEYSWPICIKTDEDRKIHWKNRKKQLKTEVQLNASKSMFF